MTIRVYSSLDAGAPTPPASTSLRDIDTLKTVLKACLVDGYPGKPAAGWTLGHEHADGISFGNGERFISFHRPNPASSGLQVTLMESVTDTGEALPTGVNRRSGPWYDGNPTNLRHWVDVPLAGANQAVRGWLVVADDKTVTCLFYGGPASQFTDGAESHNSRRQAWHFGQFYPMLGGVGFICLGGCISTNSSTSNSYLFRASYTTGTCLRNPFTGTTDLGADATVRAYLGIFSSSVNQQPNYLLNRTLQLVRCGVGVTGAVFTSISAAPQAGALRGLLYDPGLVHIRANAIFPLLGVSSPTPDSLLQPIDVGGKQLFVLAPHTTDGCGFLSLDEADWDPLWTL